MAAGAVCYTREVSVVDMTAELGLTGDRLSSSRMKGTSESMASLTSGSESHRAAGPTRMCTLIAVCLLVSMITSIAFTVGALMVLLETGRLTTTGRPAMARVCVPCEALRISHDPVDDMTAGFDRDGELCCTRNASQLQTLITSIAQREIKKAKAEAPPPFVANHFQGVIPANSTELPSSGNLYALHLTLKRDNDDVGDSNQDDFQLLRNWGGRPSSRVVRKGMKVDQRRGRFIVKRGGLYFFSSRLLFLPPIHSLNTTSHFFSQRLSRENPRFMALGIEPLLEDTQERVCATPRRRSVCHTSVMASLVYLRRGDELFLSATHKRQLSVAPHAASHVDLFRID